LLLDLLSKSDCNPITPRRSPSNYELSRQLNSSFESNGINCDLECKLLTSPAPSSLCSPGEVDPVFHQQFLEWKKSPTLKKESSFINNIYEQEIYPVLNFKNQSLTKMLLRAIEENSIAIESISDKSPFPK